MLLGLPCVLRSFYLNKLDLLNIHFTYSIWTGFTFQFLNFLFEYILKDGTTVSEDSVNMFHIYSSLI